LPIKLLNRTGAVINGFLISAEGDGGDTPTPAPPPNGEGQTISDTTFIFLGGEDSTFYDME